MQIDSM